MPIIYVCTVITCKDRLHCATCMIGNHSHHEKMLVNIKQYLTQYILLEEDRNKLLKKN
jgi:hypothetical protein